MHIIIKGVETIEECKQCYALMHGMADEFRKKHNGYLDSWIHGEIHDVWMDKDGNLYLSYEDGFSGMFAKRKKRVEKGWRRSAYLLL